MPAAFFSHTMILAPRPYMAQYETYLLPASHVGSIRAAYSMIFIETRVDFCRMPILYRRVVGPDDRVGAPCVLVGTWAPP